MSKDAIKLALEALNDAWGYGTQRLDDKITKAIKALEEALAKQEQAYQQAQRAQLPESPL
ncbi:MAG: hypothetical protein RL018_1319 [Pseudomonadota bacterium]|jgi:cellobiose-specific phosphotransferase system component IIA